MTSQCPRCGAPRMGDFPFCHHCGLDLRQSGAPSMPPQQQLPPQQPIYGSPQQPIYGSPQQTFGPPTAPIAPYGQPQAPYYYPPQQAQPPAYQQPNQGTTPWQASQPAASPAPLAPYAPPTPAASFGTAASTDAQAAADSADVAALDQSATAPTDAATDASSATGTATPAAPTVCLRCYAPLYPGYSHCTNCGFDNNIVYGALAAQASRGIPAIAYALTLLGAGLIVAAAALVLVAAH